MTSASISNGPVLRDIHVPHVSWWPPAPGWWLLALVILVSIIAIAVMVPRYRRRRRPLLAARRELDALDARHARDRDAAAVAAGVSRLLRRIALTIDPAAAAYEGEAWRNFIQRNGRGAFTREQLDHLSDAPFRARASFDVEATMDAARKWCESALRRRGNKRVGSPPLHSNPLSSGRRETRAQHSMSGGDSHSASREAPSGRLP